MDMILRYITIWMKSMESNGSSWIWYYYILRFEWNQWKVMDPHGYDITIYYDLNEINGK